MKNNTKKILLFAIKLILGITFVYSSFHKIQDPASFAKILYGYAIFPDITINIMAIIIPFIELSTGFCLIFGVFPRAAILIINAMLIAFIILITFNLLRGHQFDCGCFSSTAAQNPLLANIYSLGRDILLLGAGIFYWRNA